MDGFMDAYCLLSLRYYPVEVWPRKRGEGSLCAAHVNTRPSGVDCMHVGSIVCIAMMSKWCVCPGERTSDHHVYIG